MLQLWKARRGRKAAIALIAPLIEKSRVRLGGIPDAAWHDAYMIGFLAMLVSLRAQDEAGSLRSNALGLVQSEALAELTGHAADVIGETICVLSMEQDVWFAHGCQDAVNFHASLDPHEGFMWQDGNLHSPRPDCPLGLGMDPYELWKQSFEARIAFLS